MKLLVYIPIMISAFCLLGCTEQSATHTKYEVGQVWKYKTRKGEEQSTIMILKIEEYDTLGLVLHTSVNGVKIKNPRCPSGFSETINHLPISEEALDRSVTTLVAKDANLPDFTQGYAYWKEAFNSGQGGIFSVEVKDAVKYTEETFRTGREVVTE